MAGGQHQGDEPEKVESFEDVNRKLSFWSRLLWGDRREKSVFEASHAGRIENLEAKEVQREKDAAANKARVNLVLTWVLAPAFGALGLWLATRLLGG